MRRAVDAFKALYGAAACVGIENLCNSDWQSSDHSDVGQASQEVWNEFRDKAAAGRKGLETRRLEWRSTKVCLWI